MIKCPQCGYERTSNDDHFVSSEECPKCGIFYKKLNPSSVNQNNTEPIITNSKTPDGNKEKIAALATETKRFNNTPNEAKKIVIPITLGVLFYILSFLPPALNKLTPGKLSALSPLITVIIGGTFKFLGNGLILVGIVLVIRALVYKRRKTSAYLKSNESILVSEAVSDINKEKTLSLKKKKINSYNPKEGKKSAKFIGYGLLCLISGITIFFSYIFFVMPPNTHGKVEPLFVVVIMICGFCQLAAFILMIAGTMIGFRTIFRRRELEESLQIKDDQNIDQQRNIGKNWGAEWVSVIALPLTILLAFIFLMAMLWGNNP